MAGVKGRSGPRRKNRHLAAVENNKASRRAAHAGKSGGDSEPEPPARITEIPDPPCVLSRDAKKRWPILMRDLIALGTVAPTDLHKAALLCESFAEWERAHRTLRQKGYTFETMDQAGNLIPRARPEVKIAHDARRVCHQFMADFGMDPSARDRMGIKAKVFGAPEAEPGDSAPAKAVGHFDD